MIVSLTADYFRKHEHLDLNLTTGLNVLRGANESGKTTVTEAVLYALYGAKALRNTLAETVTWGQKDSALKVKLVMRIAGIDYVFTRSKNGAECVYCDGKVTGQVEVTNFAATLLGADARTASLLMLASQNGLRGALDDGPAAVSSLMGKLADFDTIDRLLIGAAATLALGAELPWTNKLAEAEAELLAAREAINPVDVEAVLAADEARLANEVVLAEEQTDKLQDACTAAHDKLEEAKALASDRWQALNAINKIKEGIDLTRLKLTAAEAEALKMPDPDRMASLQTELDAIGNQAYTIAAYKAFQGLGPYPGLAWDKPKEDFEQALASDRAKEQELRSRRKEIEGEVRQLKAGLITNGKCPTCGSTKTSDEHVAEINGAIQAKLTPLQVEYDGLGVALAEAVDQVKAMEEVEASAKRREACTGPIANYLTFNSSVYPPTVEWQYEVPVVRDAGPLMRELSALKALGEAANVAKGRALAHASALADMDADLVKSQAAFDAMPVPNVAELTEASNVAYSAYQAASTSLSALRQQHATVLREIEDYRRDAAAQAARFEAAKVRVEQAKADIATLQFNNIFVKKLKALKPSITDFLWNSVLSAVSNFFSTLRGEQSIVAKTEDGFRVNGQSIESLSGSTLDVLALAIRVALSKTFIPHASFMVLDEPAHGCDTTRTSNVLGFLSGVGFEQTLLASHDELSESVANNVIAIGA